MDFACEWWSHTRLYAILLDVFRGWIASLVVICAGVLSAQQLRVTLEPEQVFIGDPIRLTIRVFGDGISDIRPAFSGPVEQRGIRLGMSSTVTLEYVPLEVGRCTLEGLEVDTHSGGTLTYPEQLTVEVVPVPPDPKVQLTSSVEQKTVYPGDTVMQRITLRTPYLKTRQRVMSPFLETNLWGEYISREPRLTFKEEPSEDLALRVIDDLKTVSREIEGDQLVWIWEVPYQAMRSGTHTFLTPLLNDTYYTLDSGMEPEAHRVMVTAEPLMQTVTMPPVEGRPQGYTGAIGERFSVTASVSGHNVQVEDPVLLTLTIETDCDPALIVAPKLPKMKGFRATGEAKREIHEGGCTLSYDLRPIEAGLLEIPALELAYFERSSERYKTVSTWAFPLSVKASQQALYLDKDTAPSDQIPPLPLLLSQSAGADVRPRMWTLLLFFGGLGAFLVRILARPVRVLMVKLFAPLARRRPTTYVRTLIKRATSPSEIADALRFWAGRPALTATELQHILPASDAASRLVAAYHEVERALYGGGMDLEAVRSTLLEVLEQVPCPRKHTRGASQRLGLFFVLGLLPLCLGASPHAFLREQAEVVTIAAASPENFAQAANFWLRLHAQGDCSREVLLNGATCALFAHHPTTAEQLLQRYERLYGRDESSRQGMALVVEQQGVSLPWTYRLLSGHFRWDLGRRTEALCCVAGVLLLLCALPVRRLRVVRALVALVTLVLAISVLTSWVQEWTLDIPTALPESEVTP